MRKVTVTAVILVAMTKKIKHENQHAACLILFVSYKSLGYGHIFVDVIKSEFIYKP